MSKAITILGIDPGYGITGYGVIEMVGGKRRCLNYGVIRTECGEAFSERLKCLHQDLKQIIKKYQPDCIAVEQLFFYNNAKTAIKVGEARGVIMLTAIINKLKILEFTPLQVKQAISGYGNADKRQVQQMVKILLNLKSLPAPDDAADALAIALTAGQELIFSRQAI